jgi:adenylate cyclase
MTEPSKAVFLSYASQDAEAAQCICDALRAAGIEVWFDQSELRGGDVWDHKIRKQIHDCALFIPIISAHTQARTEGYFRLEWHLADQRKLLMTKSRPFLVPVCIDSTPNADADVPDSFTAVQWTRLRPGETPPSFVERIARLMSAEPAHALAAVGAAGPAEAMMARPRGAETAPENSSSTASVSGPARAAICVLPFANMSGDPEQEYFSDGITEDVITDLSKVSALAVISRNSAFVYKGKNVDVPKVAQQLNVGYVLEGSVRKAGGRVRITAQLVNASSNDHVWAERYDRDLNDIFALQDEIAHAIVRALRLKLLPGEKKAIEQRGTDKPDAYNLYLMARQYYATGNEGDTERAEKIVRLCSRATEIDPRYARAWALMAFGKIILRYVHGRRFDDGLEDADRALALDPNLAEAHAAKARILSEEGGYDAASSEIDSALRLDAESYEVNRSAAYLRYRQRRTEEAIRYFEKARTLLETDINSAHMLISCYTAAGNSQGAVRSARALLTRTEEILAQDPNNGTAVAYAAEAMATLGDVDRAKEYMNRALLIDPDNLKMRYNFACVLTTQLGDIDAGLELLGPVFDKMAIGLLNHAKADSDLDPLRQDPRFKDMLAAAEARLS